MSIQAKEMVDRLRQETLQYIRDHPEIRAEADAMAERVAVIQACLQSCMDAGHPRDDLEAAMLLSKQTLDNKRIDVKRQAVAIILGSKTVEERKALWGAIQISRPAVNNTDWI